jgi:hypothetical protein
VTQYAEPIPYGLAEVMWTAWQNLAIEGNFQNVEVVIGATQPLSGKNCLNFNTPKQPQWADVNAAIQRMTWDIGKGITNVQFGAPLRLTGNELIDAIRATRYRITTIDLAYIFGGAIAAGMGITRMSRKHHARNSQNGEANKQIEIIGSQPGGETTGVYIVIDSTWDGTGPPPTATISLQDIADAWQANTTPPTS